jgi:hypothetical protein
MVYIGSLEDVMQIEIVISETKDKFRGPRRPGCVEIAPRWRAE